VASCYLCGRNLEKSEPRYRREVYTGHSNRIGISRRSGWVGTSAHYAVRVVCGACASALDAESQLQEESADRFLRVGMILGLIAAVGVLIMVALIGR